MKIGVVTVLSDTDGLIEGLVASMNRQCFRNFELYVVENEGSNFKREEYIRLKLNSPYTFRRNLRNVGIATAMNQGIDYFLADKSFTHILFLSDNVEVDTLFLKRHADIMRAVPKVDALAPKLMHDARVGGVLYAGGSLSYLNGGFKNFNRDKIDKLLSRTLFRVDYAPICSLMVKTWPLRDSGVRMWDELFVCHDNAIFCHELQQAGFHMYFTPKIEVMCKVLPVNSKENTDVSNYYMTRNWLYWGLRRRNFAVLASAMFLYVFHTAVRNETKLQAMRDAVRMSRYAEPALSRAHL